MIKASWMVKCSAILTPIALLTSHAHADHIEGHVEGITVSYGVALGIAVAMLVALILLLYYRIRFIAQHKQIQRMSVESIKLGRKGKVNQPMTVAGPGDIRELAQNMNAVISRLDARIMEEGAQRRELEAIMSNMVQGVFVVDAEERIISMNDAAIRLLDLNSEQYEGLLMAEVTRSRGIQRLVEQAMNSDTLVEEEIEVRHKEFEMPDAQLRVQLQAHGSALRDSTNQLIGTLVVLNDVSSLRRAESVRRDFVANVSHELKTPVAAIKGSAETAMDFMQEDPEAATRFLAVITRQADRLHQIIEDLLSLARIEQGHTSMQQLDTIEWQISDIIDVAMEASQAAKGNDDQVIEVDCPSYLQARVHHQLLEQAVGNLIDNAKKYSGEATVIQIAAELIGQEIVISVQDDGVGIAAKHLPRLFERFYRPDKARSRAVGGTGLGLAIVKHVAQAHGGRATVESRLGHGTRFCIHLPVTPDMIGAMQRAKKNEPSDTKDGKPSKDQSSSSKRPAENKDSSAPVSLN